jgi:hypothetical protein
MVNHNYNPSWVGSRDIRIAVDAGPRQKKLCELSEKASEKDWGHSSNG